jgi:hypothetical protein
VSAEVPHQLSKEQCLAKAKECRDLARAAAKKQHRVMLDHIAETWERLAEAAK